MQAARSSGNNQFENTAPIFTLLKEATARYWTTGPGKKLEDCRRTEKEPILSVVNFVASFVGFFGRKLGRYGRQQVEGRSDKVDDEAYDQVLGCPS